MKKNYGHIHSRMTSEQSARVRALQDEGWKIICINHRLEVLLYHNDIKDHKIIPR